MMTNNPLNLNRKKVFMSRPGWKNSVMERMRKTEHTVFGPNAKRGYVPEDAGNFSPDALRILRSASRHVLYLINEGYDLKQAVTFVGNHYLLSERQRLAIMRSAATDQQLAGRKERRISPDNLQGKEVWIDGFNTIITLEVMLSRSLLFVCMDGTVRDLASLRGTYRLIPETKEAVRMMLCFLREKGAEKAHILLDEPVSNSGRLKSLIMDTAEGIFPEPDVQIRKDVDRQLYQKENVITSDSVILDHCKSWINMTAECMKELNITGIRVW